jgi:hypothetical protein
MASGHALSFLADEQDAPILLGRLNADPEIAFVVPDGPRTPPRNARMPASPSTGDRPPTNGFVSQPAICGGGWRAVRLVKGREDGEYIFWHISAGPLVGDYSVGRDNRVLGEFRPIPDPWPGGLPSPLCGPNILGAATIRLTLQTRYAAYTPQERTALHPLNAYWTKGDVLGASSSNGPVRPCNPVAPCKPQR